MTHRPEAEEFLQHLIGPDHACSEAISLRAAIMNEVANRRRSATLIPAEGTLQIDVTSEVADAIAIRLAEFRELHAEHHLTPDLQEDVPDGGQD
jgi:hypothetical protein